MSLYDLSDRDRLLICSRTVNGVQFQMHNDDDHRAMQAMVEEGLFTYSTSMFSEGYWWTPEGERAAEAAWQSAPVEPFETRYRNHPAVRIRLNGNKEELCHVGELWVRNVFGNCWLVDHPDGEETVRFDSADGAIEWALAQVGA